MSPGDRLARLVAEVDAELVRVDRVAAELAAALPHLVPDCDPAIRMAVAGWLHGFYTGCEAVLARIARVIGGMPSGDAWHQHLLFAAAAPVPGVRPPVIAAPTAATLGDLLRFRHFFRSSYGVELDVARLRVLAESLPELRRLFRQDVEAFLRALQAAG